MSTNDKDLTDLGGFTIGQWKQKREILKKNLDYSEEWDEVVNWYDQRLQNRYFEPMKRIEKHASGEGFSLMTIHCALIEHFAAITQGKIYNHKKNNSSPNYEYKSSSTHFTDFLKSSKLFSEYFGTSQNSEPKFDSMDFYSNVRCALLHEAYTKNDWRINTLSCGFSNPDKKIFTKNDSGVKRIFRDLLTQKLSKFLNEYKEELRSNLKLRLYFARKMDHLCEIEPDPTSYEWWKEL